MDLLIPVTQLRTNIATILKRLRENPRIVYKITHHKEVIAELKAPERLHHQNTDASTEQELATFIETFLKGGVPKKKGAYRRIRKLCATPSDQLPYKSLEEAITAIRRRSHGPDRF